MNQPARSLNLAGTMIVIAANASPTLRYAAAELARGLYRLSGQPCRVGHAPPERGPYVRLHAECSDMPRPDIAAQSAHLHGARDGRRKFLSITGATPTGCLYGVYELLEYYGMGFLAGGETLPDAAPISDLRVPDDFDRRIRPAFKVRGNMLHYNFLCGCTCWGLADYKFYFDQLARMRCNLLLMHWYDNEPGAASEVAGEYLEGGPTPNSLSRPWGALAALRTAEYSFDSGQYFDAEIGSSPMGEDFPHPIEEIKRSEAVFAAAVDYARTAGIQIAAGFEIPTGDPTSDAVRKRFFARLDTFMTHYPGLTHLAIWQREGGACSGTRLPDPGSDARRLFDRERLKFERLGHDSRIWEAIRTLEFTRMAAEWLDRESPDKALVLVGWGGDRWMRFADLCLLYDPLLPRHVIFSCHDNIDASWGPNISAPWGSLPSDRERWAMPWVEGDLDECWVRQPNVESLGRLAPDALKKQCQGLLTLQWRTRDVEEETGYIARFAWDATLTPARYYRDLGRWIFGEDNAVPGARIIGALQRLGSRWTGVRGSVECGQMGWTGHTPHYPFDLDGAAALYLADMAAEASDALAIVPENPNDPASAAFHLRDTSDAETLPRDRNRFGVRPLADTAMRLRALGKTDRPDNLRREFKHLQASLWETRTELIRIGMTTHAIRALDGFLIALHHMIRNAGASRKMPRLRSLRRRIGAMRDHAWGAGRIERVERLDSLASTMDFVLHYDLVAMRMADGEDVDQTVAKASSALDKGNAAKAARIAAEGYTRVIEAGMQAAVAALAAKLTTRTDWGVLTTFNIKAMPLYWNDLARFEPFMPVVPPSVLRACAGDGGDVWLSWEPKSPSGKGQILYRRRRGSRAWHRVRQAPFSPKCHMAVDRPGKAGEWEYALSVLDHQNWESPRSHPVSVALGPDGPVPRIYAPKPHGRAMQGEDLSLRVVVTASRRVSNVCALFRRVGENTWAAAPLHPTFRNGYAGRIPGARLEPGLWAFFVMAFSGEEPVDVWPAATAQGRPWTISILPRPGA